MKNHKNIAEKIRSSEAGTNKHKKITVFVILLISIALLCFN
ncbi:Uncharacterised protein [Legionella quateirensis]|uniref:Uncharacterized protein n=1 Tax=Legionella quateirensis TaxID=45072 RepID=A0A378KWN6_9GAMM|nr:Uncharacterised protein [Legionella quateirensis]